MTSSITLDKRFNYRHFDRGIIILCVRWYVAGKPKVNQLCFRYGVIERSTDIVE